MLIITEVVVVVVATVALLATVGEVWSSVCFNPQFAVFEIGEFSLLVVELNLTSLSNGQIRRDSNAFSPEQVPESSVSQDFHSVTPSVEFHNQRLWLVAALSVGADLMRSLYVRMVPGSRGAALIQYIHDHVGVRSVVTSCRFPYSKKFQIAPAGNHAY